LAELDTADRQEPAAAQSRSARLEDKITALKAQIATLKEIEARLQTTGETQISLTDPDARPITSGAGIAGYNVQTAVDAKHLDRTAASLGRCCYVRWIGRRPGAGRLDGQSRRGMPGARTQGKEAVAKWPIAGGS
jgi:hypothetical protein